jgi:RNA polymerase sigma-70 factor (ECF subfamily)
VVQPVAQHAEKDLIARVLAGQREYFHDLVRPYERAVYLIALAMLGNRADAEEAAQETVLKTMLHLDQLDDPAKFKSWLLQIATNEARLKRRSRHEALFDSLDSTEGGNDSEFTPRDFADWREDPSEALERSEVRSALARALEKLPDRYREIFVLRDIEELSIEQCGRILGVTNETVKVRLHRARLRIREQSAPLFRKTGFFRRFSFRGKKPW